MTEEELKQKEEELKQKEEALKLKEEALKDNSSGTVDETLLQKKVDEAVKKAKESLDKAFKERDDALKEIASYKQKEKEENLKKLQEEGKHKEAFEMQLKEMNAELVTLRSRNTELTRDIVVKDVLSSYQFKSPRAFDLATREVIAELVQDEKGAWTHKSGKTIETFVEEFNKNPDNAFLFKQPTSSGGGTSGTQNNSGKGGGKKSLFEMSQEEVLKLAAEGKLRR